MCFPSTAYVGVSFCHYPKACSSPIVPVDNLGKYPTHAVTYCGTGKEQLEQGEVYALSVLREH